MSNTIPFACEAIINFPKVLAEEGKFSCTLYFTTETYDTNLKAVYDVAKQEFKRAKCTLKEIKDKSKAVADILGSDYGYSQQGNSRLEYVKAVDLYAKAIDLATLKSGDKVFIKGCLAQTKKPNTTGQYYITIYMNMVAKIGDQVFTLHSNADFYDSLEQYRVEFDTDNGPDAEEDVEEVSEKCEWDD